MRKLICPGMISPWHEGGDLGAAYNEWVNLLGWEYEWAVFKDHDVEMMHRDWFERLERAIADTPGAGAFACRVNKQHPGNESQSLQLERDMNDGERLAVARDVRAAGRGIVSRAATDTRHLISGCWLAVNLDAVQRVGGFAAGFQGVDWNIHRKLDRAGFPVYVIEGLFVWHRYRHRMEVA